MLHLLGASKQTTWEHEGELPLGLYSSLPLKHTLICHTKLNQRKVYTSAFLNAYPGCPEPQVGRQQAHNAFHIETRSVPSGQVFSGKSNKPSSSIAVYLLFFLKHKLVPILLHLTNSTCSYGRKPISKNNHNRASGFAGSGE